MLSNLNTLYLYFRVHFYVSLAIDILIIVCGMLYYAIQYKRGRYNTVQMMAGIVLTICTALILLFTVLGRRFNKYPSQVIDLDLIRAYKSVIQDRGRLNEVLLNIGMFMPVGASLSLLRVKDSRIIFPTVYCFVLSLAIEICQLIFKSGYFEPVDIINNTLGGLIGVIGCLLVCRLVRDRKQL